MCLGEVQAWLETVKQCCVSWKAHRQVYTEKAEVSEADSPAAMQSQDKSKLIGEGLKGLLFCF